MYKLSEEGMQIFYFDNKEINLNNGNPFEKILSVVAYVICSAYHQTYGHSPAQLVYCCDMFLSVEQKNSKEKINNRKQKKI